MRVTRSQLASFLPNNESIRIFEELVGVANSAQSSAGALSVVRQEVTTTSLADTGLQFQVEVNKPVKFEFFGAYTASAGVRFTVDGPAGSVYYTSEYSLTDTSSTVVNASAYLLPASVNASSLSAGTAKIEGVIVPAENGTLRIKFESAAPITLKAGYLRSILLT